MIRALRRLTGPLVLSLILGAMLPSSARALPVTVDGTTHDVVFFQGPTTRAAHIDTIDDAPWWGSEALATDFATQYLAQQGTAAFDLNPTRDRLVFILSNSARPTPVQVELEDDDLSGTFIRAFEQFGDGLARFHFAYVSTATPVPEIDGGALGQGAVILLALWLMVRRRAGVRLRRVAQGAPA